MDNIKILVVDDESRMRKLVGDFLLKKDYRVIEAADGQEAIDIFFENNDISLVILDVMMPKMDGWEVLKEIRTYSKVPVIMLTAKGDERDELNGFDPSVLYFHVDRGGTSARCLISHVKFLSACLLYLPEDLRSRTCR